MNTEAVPRLSPGAVARPPRPGVGWLQRGPCSSLCSPPPPPHATSGALLLSSALFFPDRRLQHLTPQHQFYGLQIHPNQSLHLLAVSPFPAHLAASQATCMSQPVFLSPLAPVSLLLPPGYHLPWCLGFSLQSWQPLFWFPWSGWKICHTSPTDFENFSRKPLVL